MLWRDEQVPGRLPFGDSTGANAHWRDLLGTSVVLDIYMALSDPLDGLNSFQATPQRYDLGAVPHFFNGNLT
jgi:hypothetical protein